MSTRHVIVSKEDVTLLVNEFYKKVNADALLAPFFRDILWDHHLPHLVNFWSMVRFGDTSFEGNPVTSHSGTRWRQNTSTAACSSSTKHSMNTLLE